VSGVVAFAVDRIKKELLPRYPHVDAVVADTSPKEAGGLSGALFNTFGNVAGITTPIVIGYILQGTGSFAGALVYVGANAA